MDDTLLQRQKALAQFGAKALSAADIGSLLREACRLVAQGSASPISKVLKRMPGDRDLLLCASEGIPPEVGVPGKTTIAGGDRSAAGFAVESRQPVVSHVPTEKRFDAGEVVRRMGVVHSINVVILCENDPYGALEADRTDERSFDQADVDFLQTYANVLGAAIQQRRNVDRIEALLTTQTLLFRELQHRVKNDLQIILTLIQLQQRQARGETKQHLEIIEGRIGALSLIHERMFAGRAVDRVDLSQYLGQLAATRFQMHGLDTNAAILLRTELGAIAVDHDRAVALGLIANEFLTNSLKYAFPQGRGEVAIIGATDGGRVTLTFADNGIGKTSNPEDRDNGGTGQRLIALLAKQIEADTTWSHDKGTRLTLTFTVA